MLVLKKKTIWSKYPYGLARTSGPYAYGPNTRMVWNKDINNHKSHTCICLHDYLPLLCTFLVHFLRLILIKELSVFQTCQ